jgi:Tol biopolymer transport system component
MRGRPWPMLIAEGLSLLVLLAVLGTIGVSLGAAVNDGLKSSLAKKPVDSAPAWSPDGSLIAFVRTLRDEGTIYVMDADGAEQIEISPAAPGSGLSWVGRRVAFLRSGRVFAATADGAEIRRLRDGPSAAALSAPRKEALSPDGAHLAFVREGHIFVGDRDGGGAIQITGT